MNKRFMLVTLLLVLIMAATACGSDSGSDSDKRSGEVNAPAQTQVVEAPATAAPAAAMTEFVTLKPQEAYNQLQANPAAVIVDVRNPDEWATTGVPPSAMLIPLPELAERASGELSKDSTIYVICNSGNRSRTASQTLIDLGYPQVYNVDGGIIAWLEAGLPTERYIP